jgi:hypothetical protein
MNLVVLLDLDECLGSFGAASAFFYEIHKRRNRRRFPFNPGEIKYISTHLISNCIRPGILAFLNKLYKNRNRVDVILFTNHCNDSFLPFLQHCLNYLVTGKIRVANNPLRFFKDWYTREDSRRKTTPEKNIQEILISTYGSAGKKRRAIMFDDCPEKIIADDTYHTVIEVPEYDWDPPYTYFKKCWNQIMDTPFPSKSVVESWDKDFQYWHSSMPSKTQKEEFVNETFEFFDEPYL